MLPREKSGQFEGKIWRYHWKLSHLYIKMGSLDLERLVASLVLVTQKNRSDKREPIDLGVQFKCILSRHLKHQATMRRAVWHFENATKKCIRATEATSCCKVQPILNVPRRLAGTSHQITIMHKTKQNNSLFWCCCAGKGFDRLQAHCPAAVSVGLDTTSGTRKFALEKQDTPFNSPKQKQ